MSNPKIPDDLQQLHINAKETCARLNADPTSIMSIDPAIAFRVYELIERIASLNAKNEIIEAQNETLRSGFDGLDEQNKRMRDELKRVYELVNHWYGESLKFERERDLLREQSENRHERCLSYAKEVDELCEQLRKMQEPVSDKEWNGCFAFTHDPINGSIPRSGLNAFIQRRAAKAKEAINEAPSFQSSTARAYWGRNQEAGKGNDAKKG